MAQASKDASWHHFGVLKENRSTLKSAEELMGEAQMLANKCMQPGEVMRTFWALVTGERGPFSSKREVSYSLHINNAKIAQIELRKIASEFRVKVEDRQNWQLRMSFLAEQDETAAKQGEEHSDKADAEEELKVLREEKKAREKEEHAKQQAAAGGGGGAKANKTAKSPRWSTVAQHLDLDNLAGGKYAPCPRAAGVCFHNHDVLLKAVLQKAFPNNRAAYWQMPSHKAVMEAGIAAMK